MIVISSWYLRVYSQVHIETTCATNLDTSVGEQICARIFTLYVALYIRDTYRKS